MKAPLSVRGLAHLGVVYVVWSTTYLAIKLGITEGSGIPPFIFVGGRVLCASLIIFAILLICRMKIKITLREGLKLAGTGILMWPLGNGLVVLAERTISTGFAAVIIGTTPIWSTLFDSILNKRKPSLFIIGSIILSFAGLGLVLKGQFGENMQFDLTGVLLAFGGTLTWAFAMNVQKKYPIQIPTLAIAAWQQFFAAIFVITLSVIMKEGMPHPTTQALAAWVYLTIVGSIIAFTSFLTMVRLLPMPVATTYAYVNPVFAVILGRIFLAERIDGWTLLGMAVVLAGIAGIYYKKK